MVNKGRVPFHEHDDRDIREALAEALGERKVRLTDRRLLVIYLLLIGLVAWLGVVVRQSNEDRARFEHVLTKACEANQHNADGINSIIDKLVTSYETSPVLSERQRKLRSQFFATAHQTVPTCPPRR